MLALMAKQKFAVLLKNHLLQSTWSGGFDSENTVFAESSQ
jgi:hypothetical protein